MPLITFPYAALEAGLARGATRAPPDRAAVLDALGAFGCALDGRPDGEELTVEALMNRPDLFSVEGIARALRAFLSLGPPPHYEALQGAVSVDVDPAVIAIRPEIACAVVRGVELDAATLRRVIDAQEKLDLTYGRKRSRLSIGLHDLAPLTPPIMYTAADPASVSFVPLFSQQLWGKPRALTLSEILALHPKGVEYAALLAGKPKVPLLVDAKGGVLSMPPIINGTLTEVKPGKRDLFVDVTGTSRPPVEAAARLLALALVDLGGTLETVEVRRPGAAPASEPALPVARSELAVAEAQALVGVPLRADEVALALERMGHRALVAPGGRSLVVESPPWRFDLLHGCDLIEDVAIGLGYRNVAGTLPRLPTLGAEEPVASLKRRARNALVGLGFLEVMTLTLTSPDAAGNPGAPPGAMVLNPITREHSQLRTSLLPGLLAVLARNSNRDLPQGIFEVGDVVLGHTNEPHVALAYVGADASFTRAKGLVAALLESLALPFEVAPAEAAGLTPGRAAQVRVAGAAAGMFGEVAPRELARLSLVHPAITASLSLRALAPAAA